MLALTTSPSVKSADLRLLRSPSLFQAFRHWVQLNSLPTYRRTLLSERLEQANVPHNEISFLHKIFHQYCFRFLLELTIVH